MGQLVKALIVAPESGVKVNVMFNPKELQVDKTVSWTPKNSHMEDPDQEFKEPQSASLSVTLYFDGFETNTDVYQSHVKALEKCALMGPPGRPPITIFVWGSFKFQGVVESVSQKYTMFGEDGKRLRCEVAFKMKSARKAIVSAKGKEATGGSGSGD